MKRLAAALCIMMCSSLAHGATLLFSDDFEGPNPLSTKYTGCTTGTTPNGRQSVVTTLAHSGTHSAYYDVVSPNDPSNSCSVALPAPPRNDFYISIWLNYPTAYNSNGHMWRIFNAALTSIPQFDNGADAQGSSTVDWDIDPLMTATGTPTFFSAYTLPKGQWVRLEIEFHQGTGTNGTIRAWYTDNAGLHKWRAPTCGGGGCPSGCDVCSVDGCTGCDWGSGANLVNFYLATNVNNVSGSTGYYTDDVEIWDTCPPSGAACSTGGSDSTPPAAPRNLRVQ